MIITKIILHIIILSDLLFGLLFLQQFLLPLRELLQSHNTTQHSTRAFQSNL